MQSTAGPNGCIELTIEDNVAELRSTDPDRRNCVSFDFVEDLHAHIDAVEATIDDMYAIVMTHEGDVFCAGYDLDVMAGDNEDLRLDLREQYHAARAWLHNVDVPVVVGARGPAVAAGATHLLTGDIVVVSPEFRVWWPEITVGLFPPSMAPRYLERLGPRRAAEVVFLGEEAKLGPEESRELGLVNRIVDADEVEGTVRGMGETLSGYEREYGYLLDAYETFNVAKREYRAATNGGTALGEWQWTYEEWFGDSDSRTGGRGDPRET